MKEKMRVYLKEYGLFFCFILLGIVITLVPLPYYVEGPGGLISVSDRFSIEGSEESNYYMAYVSSYKGTLMNILMANIKDDYDVYKKTEEMGTSKEDDYRNHLMLEEANQDALIFAYLKALKEVKIIKEEIYITYVDNAFKNDFKVGDKILTMNGIEITSKESLKKVISESNTDEKILFQVENDGKVEERYAYIEEIDGSKMIGILPTLKREIEVDPEIEFHFEKSESGSSGGFMMTLAIYDALTNANYSKNLKIAGTGTIDIDGNVGKIGGVKYKILGAIEEEADIFFVPSENYEEAKETLEKEKSNVKLIEIKTFDEALEYLKKV